MFLKFAIGNGNFFPFLLLVGNFSIRTIIVVLKLCNTDYLKNGILQTHVSQRGAWGYPFRWPTWPELFSKTLFSFLMCAQWSFPEAAGCMMLQQFECRAEMILHCFPLVQTLKRSAKHKTILLFSLTWFCFRKHFLIKIIFMLLFNGLIIGIFIFHFLHSNMVHFNQYNPH